MQNSVLSGIVVAATAWLAAWPRGARRDSAAVRAKSLRLQWTVFGHVQPDDSRSLPTLPGELRDSPGAMRCERQRPQRRAAAGESNETHAGQRRSRNKAVAARARHRA